MRYYFDTVSSTQDKAIELLNSDKVSLFDIIIAKNQTKGRGQHGKTWISDTGNLFSTFILPYVSIQKTQELSISIAYILKDIFEKLSCIKNFSVKPPNDVYLNCKKVSGVLIETHDQYVLVGIGVNIKSAPLETSNYLDIDIEVLLDYLESDLFLKTRSDK